MASLLHRLATAFLLLFAATGPTLPAAAPTTAPAPALVPGTTFTLTFSDMPPTLADMMTHNGIKPQMSVFLPRNYSPATKHPLLIFVGGGNGGTGGGPGVARKLTEEKDFVCVNFPLFKEKLDPSIPESSAQRILVREPDGRFAWPLYRQMLAQLDQAVPNIDPAHRIIGGFSNGAHATASLIDGSDGEFTRYFTAFFFIEGGGKLQHYDWLKGKPFLMVYGSEQSRPRSQQIADAAKAAGAQVTLLGMDNVGHAFPESEYPLLRDWLRGPAMQ